MRKVLLLASSPIVILLVALLVSTRSDVSSARAMAGDTIADRVFGRGGSFISSRCNLELASPTAGSLCGPYGVALDGAGNLVEPYHWR